MPRTESRMGCSLGSSGARIAGESVMVWNLLVGEGVDEKGRRVDVEGRCSGLLE